MDITLKIGTRSETVQVPEANLQGILTPNEVSVALTGEAEVRRALNEPIGTPRLRDIVHPGEKIAIITSDITRPMPTWKVMPALLDELYDAGVKREDITLVFALGSHRCHTEEEQRHLAGDRAWSEITCVDGNTADAPERAEVEQTQMPEATAEPTAEPENKKGFNDYGELLDLTETDGICVLKYKITSSATKKMMVNQNYYTVVNFIKDGGGDQYDEIQYWAVADMQDGSESKVISFTVSKDLIEKIKAGTVLPTKMGDYVDELWLLPSLR